MSQLLNHQKLLNYGFKSMHYFDTHLQRFTLLYEIEGYDCQIYLIAQLNGTNPYLTKEEIITNESSLDFLIQNTGRSYSVFVGNYSDIKNHLTVIDNEYELLKLFEAIKSPLHNS